MARCREIDRMTAERELHDYLHGVLSQSISDVLGEVTLSGVLSKGEAASLAIQTVNEWLQEDSNDRA